MPHEKEKNIDKYITNFKNSAIHALLLSFYHDRGSVVDRTISCLEYISRTKQKAHLNKSDYELIKYTIDFLISYRNRINNIYMFLFRKKIQAKSILTRSSEV